MLEATGRRTFVARRARSIVPTLLMLLLILAQSTYWIGSFNSLAHVLDHEKTGLVAPLEERHGHVLHGNGVPEPDPVSETEHNLLHQIEHSQLAPSFVSSQRVLAGMAMMVVPPLLYMGQRRNERMFRPPRYA